MKPRDMKDKFFSIPFISPREKLEPKDPDYGILPARGTTKDQILIEFIDEVGSTMGENGLLTKVKRYRLLEYAGRVQISFSAQEGRRLVFRVAPVEG